MINTELKFSDKKGINKDAFFGYIFINSAICFNERVMKMTEKNINKNYIYHATAYFTPNIKDKLIGCISSTCGIINEIRAKAGDEITLRTDNRIIRTGIGFSSDDMRLLVRALCGNSPYSHSETLKEGYIATSSGIRAGVAGRAVTENGKITGICDVTTVNIRIPARYPGAAKELCSLLESLSFKESILIYSPPSGGKTTLLRELTDELTNRSSPIKVAVVDSRCEITSGLGTGCFDTLLGYPRSKGIEIAIRTLSPQIIICDEIGGEADVKAIIEAAGAGVPIIATSHGTHEDVLCRKAVKELLDLNIFKALYGIEKKGVSIHGKITWTRNISK